VRFGGGALDERDDGERMMGKNWRKAARSACIAGMGRGKAA